MYQRILVALDGSVASEDGAVLAAELAGRTGASLELMQVASSAPPEDCAHYLAQLAQRLRFQAPGGVVAAVEPGPIIDGILRHLVQEEAELLVLTSHGRKGMLRLILGSVAEHVLRQAPCPVLVLPRLARGRHHGAFRRILVSLDGSPRSERALEPGVALARLYDAELTLLRVVTEPDPVVFPESEQGVLRVQEYLQGVARRLDLPCQLRDPVSMAIDQTIANEAEGFDLLVMASHRRDGLPRMILGSVCEQVLRHSTCPVLVVH